MSDLIERVAKAADWRWWSTDGWCDENGDVMAHPRVGLTDTGLVFLLRELLDAHMYPRRHRVTGDFQVFSDIDVCRVSASNTLEEAAMLAFLHKGER